MSILDILAKVIGANRAVSLYIFLRQWWMGLAVLVIFIAIFGAVLISSAPSRMEHIAYLTVDVTSVAPMGNQDRFGTRVDIRLADGQTLQLTTTQTLISNGITDTACVEHRRDVSTGTDDYQLRRTQSCTGD
jgi:hypothetical protein